MTKLSFSWQNSYHEHIIHQNNELDQIRQYIATNPAGWEKDTLNILNGKEGIHQ